MKTRRIIFICNTYYQLIVAIHMRSTIFVEDICDVIISDQSPGTRNICDKIEKLNLFCQVIFAETKEMCAKKNMFWKKILDLLYMVNGDSNTRNNADDFYDEIIYYNPDVYSHIIYAELKKKNKNIVCSRFEEGVLSYGNKFAIYPKLIWANLIRTFFRSGMLESETKQFYCFHKELYEGNLYPIQIPTISDSKKMGEMLAEIFNIDIKNLRYKEKYIYFSGVYDFEGGNPVGEFEVIKKVADIVGKDNLLIKIHPRDTRSIFRESGFHIDINSSIPWEAIQFNKDFTDKVFITSYSGSVLSANMMLEKRPKVIFVYRCCNSKQNEAALVTVENIEKILLNRGKGQRLDNVTILDDIKDILLI